MKNTKCSRLRNILIQHDALLFAVFLARIFPDAGDEIQIDDFRLARRLLDDQSAIFNLFQHALYAAALRGNGVDDAIFANEAVICGLTPEKACNFKEFAA